MVLGRECLSPRLDSSQHSRDTKWDFTTRLSLVSYNSFKGNVEFRASLKLMVAQLYVCTVNSILEKTIFFGPEMVNFNSKSAWLHLLWYLNNIIPTQNYNY